MPAVGETPVAAEPVRPWKPGMLGPDYARPVVDPDYGRGQQVLCGRCGAYPAVAATLREHHGVVIGRETTTDPGPFCRSCGLSEFRDMTAATLVRGWWGVLSVFITPFVLAGNVLAWLRIRKLAEPVPGSPRSPLRVGKPVHRRPAIAMAAVPLVVIGLVLYFAAGDGDTDMRKTKAGDCVVNTGTDDEPTMRQVDCAKDKPGAYVVLTRIDGTISDTGCPAETTASFAFDPRGEDDDYVVCLRDRTASDQAAPARG